MTDEKQRTLEGLVVTDRETLKEVVREVLREEGILGTLKRAAKWDRAYKGDEFWLEFRAHVVQLVRKNVVLAYRDLDQDRYFTTKAMVRQHAQWARAVDQHLIPNKPPGADGLDLVTFSVGPRSGRYLTAKAWLHCAVAKAAERQGRRDPALVRQVRVKYLAEGACELCAVRSRTYSPVSNPPDLLSSSNATKPGSALGEEELAVLHAVPEGSK